MEERLRAVELTLARLDERLNAFMDETREHRRRRNGNHWKEKGTIALGGTGVGAGVLALIERLVA